MGKATFITRTDVYLDFAKALRRLRTEAGMTQGDIHRATGIDRAYLSRLESGAFDSPRLTTLYRVSRALGTTIDAIVEAAIQPGPPTEPRPKPKPKAKSKARSA